MATTEKKKCTKNLNCEGCDTLCPFYINVEPETKEVKDELSKD